MKALDTKFKKDMGYLRFVLHSYSLLFTDMLKVGPFQTGGKHAIANAKAFKNGMRRRSCG